FCAPFSFTCPESSAHNPFLPPLNANKRVNAAHTFFRRCRPLRDCAFPIHTSNERQYGESWLDSPKGVPTESLHPLCLVPTRQVCTLNQLQGGDAFPSLFAAHLLWREAQTWEVHARQSTCP